MNLVVALAAVGGGALAVWAGITNPDGGVMGAVGRVLRGEPVAAASSSSTAGVSLGEWIEQLAAQVGGFAGAAGNPPRGAGAVGTITPDSQVSGRRVWPTNGRTVTQRYGNPNSRYEAGYHTGIDIDGETGDPIYAPVAGRVTQAGWNVREPAYGNTVSIKAGGLLIMLCHLDAVSVVPGQRVAAGKGVGRMGNTGTSSGAHLHLEVRQEPYRYGNDVNPSVIGVR